MLDLFKSFFLFSLFIRVGCFFSLGQSESTIDLSHLDRQRPNPLITHSLETQLTLNRFEKFHQIGYVYSYNQFETRAGMGYGIVRTVFQERFNPQIYVGGSYDFLKNRHFILGPTLYYSFSGYTYNKAAMANVFYHDLLVGPQFFYGIKWKVGMRLLAGPSMENLFRGVDKNKFWTYNYSAEISLRYAF